MMSNRPVTTLFLLMSLDGKISTGAVNELDIDKDFPKIEGLKEGLHQYYEIEQMTDLWSLNSGKVQAKVGVNTATFLPKGNVSFVLIDNHHLHLHGIEYFSKLSQRFVLVTSNPDHPVFRSHWDNVDVLYQEQFSPQEMLAYLYHTFDCQRITIQTGGTLNEIFLREKLLDYVDIVVAPVLIGGKDTPTLVDGPSLMSVDELNKLAVLKLECCETLENSYIRLRYKVVNGRN